MIINKILKYSYILSIGDLKRLIENYSRAGKIIEIQLIKSIMKQILSAINEIHSKGKKL